MTKRDLDHLVLATDSLSASRRRLADLGFSVAAEARHPFGTCNACVYFPDGTYLEPLAIWNRDKYDEAAAAGNVFIRYDREFRMNCGPEGLSAMVVSTQDSIADHARFAAANLSAGPKLSFARPFETADGDIRTASFRLAFARDRRAPSILVFACQRISMPHHNTTNRHLNGVVGISGVLAAADNPEDAGDLLATLGSAEDMVKCPGGIELKLSDGCISVLRPDAISHRFGLVPVQGSQSPRLVGVFFRTADLVVAEKFLRDHSIDFAKSKGRLVVGPRPGQGAYFVFEAADP